ncbi:sialate O-acetylesterase [Parabacteroides sp. PF5-9]|uniref:sialate O-acetylesterase n=1 Tax=Parabacteroides sp. PF5-9 TaxID=1742404 RepID=UPI0024769962|nr:sialate O-acetylesterase [Parabacteroides sp. PF5-9]MDH6358341.1 sialate O-acetylesterase [Parabacteroides sp. PF5-9]
MKKLIYWCILCFFAVNGSAKIKLPQLISDHMVMQQQEYVRLWGEATPNATVTIQPSWSNDATETQADVNGYWQTEINTPSAGFQTYTLTISDGEPVTLHDILIGEVWFCSGQSNMEMPLNGFWNSPIKEANHTIADAGNHPGIRMATIERKGASTPQRYANGTWKVSNPENAPSFSATAYFYALALQRTLQVPVGIISCAWGGSRVEGWLPKEILQTYEDEDLSKVGNKDKSPEYLQPMIMYNGLLYPCVNYTIKGFLWYQGCSNVGHADTYAERLATMVDHWRTLWNLGEIPFYYVEIAPYNYENNSEGISGALLREAQFKAQKLIPHSAMITTNDLVEPYESDQIHPWNKKEIGDRLAYQALNKTYGYRSIVAESPAYKSMEIKAHEIILTFDHANEGFSPWTGIEGFEISGEDKVFHPAKAVINQSERTITVSSESVSVPVAVRYCFKNFQPGNLRNHRNLAVIPFRTDHWD